jgi:hypothetical protein
MIVVPSFPRRIGSSAAAVLLISGMSVALVALPGCGGAAPEAAAPGAKSPESARSASPEPGSIEEAQAQIASARAQLGGDTGPSRFAPAPGAAPSPMSPVSPSLTPPRSTSPAAPPAADSSTASGTSGAGGGDDRCASPCRALASMRRAVDALCRMAGNDDARCTDAKRTLIDSEGRVAPCSC